MAVDGHPCFWKPHEPGMSHGVAASLGWGAEANQAYFLRSAPSHMQSKLGVHLPPAKTHRRLPCLVFLVFLVFLVPSVRNFVFATFVSSEAPERPNAQPRIHALEPRGA
jgi:hypothetical protein